MEMQLTCDALLGNYSPVVQVHQWGDYWGVLLVTDDKQYLIAVFATALKQRAIDMAFFVKSVRSDILRVLLNHAYPVLTE